MNKNHIIILILILGVGFVSLYFLTSDRSLEEELSTEEMNELIVNVFPVIESYCEDLESESLGSHCPTCRTDITECSFIKNFTEFHYPDGCILSQTEEGYSLEISKGIIYGWNTRSGDASINFTLDNVGNIISQNLEERTCL
jgi:hypothetical protein